VNKPNFLYHYTNIDTLALILEHKTFRLSSLMNMDDKQECMSRDNINIGKYIFTSCWTPNRDESIPMWYMYTSKSDGVRIGMRSNCFKEYPITKTEIKSLYPGMNVSGQENSFLIFFPVEEFMKQDFCCFPFIQEQLLIPITYTEDESLLNPTVIEREGSKFHVAFDKIGRFKNKSWEFQQEWRYKMSVMPFSIEEAMSKPDAIGQELIKRILLDNYKIPDYIDLDLSDNGLKSLEITTSPFMSVGNKDIVNLLVNVYCPNAKLIDSALEGLV
jgi:hypothetical protein